MLLYTDGLIEGRDGSDGGGTARLGTEGLAELVSRRLAAGLVDEELLESVMAEVRQLNGDELADDVAMVLLAHDAPATPRPTDASGQPAAP